MVVDGWPCDCGHARSSHSPGVECQRCGCDFYVPMADDRAEDRDGGGRGDGRAERMYERWLNRIGGP